MDRLEFKLYIAEAVARVALANNRERLRMADGVCVDIRSDALPTLNYRIRKIYPELTRKDWRFITKLDKP